jgi:pilus assembly protein CpaF
LFNRRPVKPERESTFEEIEAYIQDVITGEQYWSEEEVSERQGLLQNVLAGMPTAHLKLINLIKDLLLNEELKLLKGVNLAGRDIDSLAEEIYRRNWGLGILEEYYRDKSIDEIRVNGPGPGQVYLVRRGVSEPAERYFEDEQEIKVIARRLLMHDIAVGLDQSQPLAESMRKDGTRVTATCPPVTEYWTFVLRKHDTFEMTPENLERHGTISRRAWDMLAAFARYGVNLLIAGGTNTGKTHLLRRLVAESSPKRRIIAIETDRELNLKRHYPERDCVEFEEHSNVQATMERIFRHVLRYSADILIVGEFRGHGEAREAVNACTRGCEGSMATAHFSTVEGAIEGAAKLLITEGANIPLEMAKTMVAAAFNVVIHMAASRDLGIKKVVRIAEITPVGDQVVCRDLVVWRPSGEDYYEGDWEFVNPPSPGLISRMRQNGLPQSVAREWGWEG